MKRLRPEYTGGGQGVRDAGGQPLMWTLQLCDADSVQRDERKSERERERCVRVCVYLY